MTNRLKKLLERTMLVLALVMMIWGTGSLSAFAEDEIKIDKDFSQIGDLKDKGEGAAASDEAPQEEGDDSEAHADDSSHNSAQGLTRLGEDDDTSSNSTYSSGASIAVNNDMFNGAAVSSVPILVPPGRAGMTPSLSLVYNSNNKNNGEVGYGWTIPIRSIQRSTKHGLNYDGYDFIANGVELVRKTDWDSNGALGFCSKIEGDFVKFLFYQVSNNSHWEIKTPDGKINYYGSEIDSRQEFNYGNRVENYVFEWFLDKVSDSNGNFMEFDYIKDVFPIHHTDYTNTDVRPLYESVPAGRIYLNEIKYTGFNNGTQRLDPYYSVKLYYDKSGHRFDMTLSFLRPLPLATKWLLKFISIQSKDEFIRGYGLSYSDSNTSMKKQLTEVVQYGDDFNKSDFNSRLSSGESVTFDVNTSGISGSYLKPVRYYYENEKLAFENEVFPNVIGPSWLSKDDLKYAGINDINNDGKMDLYAYYCDYQETSPGHYSTVNGIKTYLSTTNDNGQHSFAYSDEYSISNTFSAGYDEFSGDDIFPVTTYIKKVSDCSSCNPDSPPCECSISYELEGVNNKKSISQLVSFRDLDGDNREDLVVNKVSRLSDKIDKYNPPISQIPYSDTFKVFYNNQNGLNTSNYVEYSRTAPMKYKDDQYFWALADIDGDHKDDYVYVSEEGKPIVRFNNGVDGFGPEVVGVDDTYDDFLDSYDDFDADGYSFMDLNNDGRADFICTDKSGSDLSIRIYLSTGRGGTEPIFKTITHTRAYHVTAADIIINYYFIDFNGDSIKDLVLFCQDSDYEEDNGYLEIYFGTGAPEYITREMNEYLGSINGEEYTNTFFEYVYESEPFIETPGYNHLSFGHYEDFTQWYSFADINGDGMTDFVYNNYRAVDHNYDDADVHVSYFDGLQFIPYFDFKRRSVSDFGFVKRTQFLADFTGDGRADYLYFYNDLQPILHESSSNQALNLKQVNNGLGGKTEIKYEPSSLHLEASEQHTGKRVPFVTQVVKSITVDDGFNNLLTTEFDYKGGYYSEEDEEYWGFEYVTQTRTSDKTVTQTRYYQEAYLKNRIMETIVYDKDGRTLTQANMFWQKTPIPGTENKSQFAYLDYQETTVFDHSYNGSTELKTKEDYTYTPESGYPDSGTYTAVTTTARLDENGGENEKPITKTTTLTQIGDWTWRVFEEKLDGVKAFGSGDGPVTGMVRRTQYAYSDKGNLLSKTLFKDDTTSVTIPPTPLDDEDYLYGNPVTSRDGKNYVTTTLYDDTTHTYPTSMTYPETNGISHTVTYDKYDFKYGKVTESTDENGTKRFYKYDNFGRLEKIFYGGTIESNSFLLSEKKYFDCSTRFEPYSVLVKKIMPLPTEPCPPPDGSPLHWGPACWGTAYRGTLDIPMVSSLWYIEAVEENLSLEMGIIQPAYIKETNYMDTGISSSAYVYVDGLGRKIQTVSTGMEGTTPVNLTTRYHYDNMGQNDCITGPVKSVSTAFFPAEASYWDMDYQGHPFVKTTFDVKGRPVAVETKDNATGTITSTIDYSGLETTYTNTDTELEQKTEIKDFLGRLVQVIEHNDDGDYYTYYDYNSAGDLLNVWSCGTSSQKGDACIQTTITYNGLGQKMNMTDPDMGNWAYTYDANGNLETQTDPQGKTVQFEYDALNRVTRKYYPNIAFQEAVNNPPVVYTYDNLTEGMNGKGKLYKVSNLLQGSPEGVETVVNQYDQMGNAVSVTKTINGTSYTTSNKYSSGGLLKSITYPNSVKIGYDYYETGFAKSVFKTDASDQNLGNIAEFAEYNISGKVQKTNYGQWADATTTYQYDPLSFRMTSLKTENGAGAAILDYGYSYNPSGNIKEITNNLGATPVINTYTYDNIHRLKSETSDSSTVQPSSYVYDAFGRITKKTVGVEAGTDTKTYTYSYERNGGSPIPHAVKSVNDLIPEYNERQIDYNMAGMPVKVVDTYTTHTITTDYIYDGEGARAVKRVNGTEIIYVGGHYEVEDVVPVVYIFAGSTRVAMIKGGETFFFHQNHLGSVAAITKQVGDGVNTLSSLTEYMPFGLTRTGDVTNYSNYGFTDQEADGETGLYNYDARLYDPAVGMFLTADTIVPNWADPQTLNRYSYCRNNPVMFVDPSGHFLDPVTVMFVAAVVYGTVSAGIESDWDAGAMAKGALASAITAGCFYAAGNAGGGWVLHSMAAYTSSYINTFYINGGDPRNILINTASAGFAEAAGLNGIKNPFAQFGTRTMYGGMTGGIASGICGGNFQDGFRSGFQTAAYGYFYNYTLHEGYVHLRGLWNKSHFYVGSSYGLLGFDISWDSTNPEKSNLTTGSGSLFGGQVSFGVKFDPGILENDGPLEELCKDTTGTFGMKYQSSVTFSPDLSNISISIGSGLSLPASISIPIKELDPTWGDDLYDLIH